MAYKNEEDAKAYRIANSKSAVARASKWAKENPEKRKIIAMNSYWRKRGITINGSSFSYSDFNIMFIEQDGRCKICKIHQSELSKSLSIDHDHSTGEARGLLCQKCNVILGMANDDIEILKSAIQYLGEK